VNAVATARSSTGGQTLKETENRVSVAREATRDAADAGKTSGPPVNVSTDACGAA